jgi:hypothetical protein
VADATTLMLIVTHNKTIFGQRQHGLATFPIRSPPIPLHTRLVCCGCQQGWSLDPRHSFVALESHSLYRIALRRSASHRIACSSTVAVAQLASTVVVAVVVVVAILAGATCLSLPLCTLRSDISSVPSAGRCSITCTRLPAFPSELLGKRVVSASELSRARVSVSQLSDSHKSTSTQLYSYSCVFAMDDVYSLQITPDGYGRHPTIPLLCAYVDFRPFGCPGPHMKNHVIESMNRESRSSSENSGGTH